MGEKAILFDTTRCIACRGCQVACKQWNELKAESTSNVGSYKNPLDLSSSSWITMDFMETNGDGRIRWLFNRRSCMHCTDAPCIKVCPARAIFHNDYGAVVYDREKCIGCAYCVEFCPFGVPRLDASRISGVGKMAKCTLCSHQGFDRLSMGQEPACVKTCPTRALIFGDRNEVVAEGMTRVDRLKVAHSEAYSEATLYGQKELGGLHVLYVLNGLPDLYGLPEKPELPAVATIQQDIFHRFFWVAWGAAAAALALNVVVARSRQKQRREEQD